MGLDTTHGAWHGAYSAFMLWRTEIAKLIGIDLRSMEGFNGDIKWESLPANPLHTLLNHSDCDGEIDWEECDGIANELERLIPMMPDKDLGGHVGYLTDKTQRFIEGLRYAYNMKENLEFH